MRSFVVRAAVPYFLATGKSPDPHAGRRRAAKAEKRALCSADFLVGGFTELSSSVFLSDEIPN